MKAYIELMKDDRNTDKPVAISKVTSPVVGLSLPYVTRNGFPAFFFEGEQPPMSDGESVILAPPGMVGSHRNDNLYVIDSDGNAQKLPMRTISERDYERFQHLKNSIRAEQAA